MSDLPPRLFPHAEFYSSHRNFAGAAAQGNENSENASELCKVCL